MIKELECELTKEDFKNYVIDQKKIKFIKLKKNLVTQYVLVLMFLLLLIGWLFCYWSEEWHCAIYIAFVLSMIIFCFVDYMYLFPNRTATILYDRSSSFIKRKYIINSEEGTITVRSVKKEVYNLNYCYAIENTKNNILIFTVKNEALIIPKRIFKDEQEMNEVWELIQECYNKNRDIKG